MNLKQHPQNRFSHGNVDDFWELTSLFFPPRFLWSNVCCPLNTTRCPEDLAETVEVEGLAPVEGPEVLEVGVPAEVGVALEVGGPLGVTVAAAVGLETGTEDSEAEVNLGPDRTFPRL